jgi:hypothetical protein
MGCGDGREQAVRARREGVVMIPFAHQRSFPILTPTE